MYHSLPVSLFFFLVSDLGVASDAQLFRDLGLARALPVNNLR